MRGFVWIEGVGAGQDHAVPFRELLGIEIDERAGGRAKLLFHAKAEHLNDGGIVHGGAIGVEGIRVAEATVRHKGKRFTILDG